MDIIAGFGNPLLDLTVKISSDTLLHKYNIKADDQKEISSGQMKDLLQDVQKLCPVQTPGGSTQNTLRIIQWLLVKPNSTIMYGAIGQDKQGDTLKQLVEMDHVQTRYIWKSKKPTGVSVVLVNGETRTLIAHIGAAQFIRIKDVKSEEFLKDITIVYMEAFFLTQRVPTARYIQEVSHQNEVKFVFNLNAVYMANNFTIDVLHFAEKCDVLIGNYKEYTALIQALHLQESVEEFTLNLVKNHPNSKVLKFGKVCVVTNGSEQVLCIHSNGIVDRQNVPKLDPSEIIDTNGAGDAFAAGFICALLKNLTPKECLGWGSLVAKEIINQVGCSIPIDKPNILLELSL